MAPNQGPINNNLYKEQLRILNPDPLQSDIKAQSNKQKLHESSIYSQYDMNAEYYTELNKAFKERTKKISTPLSFSSAGIKTLLALRDSAIRKKTDTDFSKFLKSDFVDQMVSSPLLGSLYGFGRGFGRRQSIQEDKALADQLGWAGRASRASRTYSQTGHLLSLPIMLSMALGKGTMGMRGLSSMLTGGAMTPMLGIAAAQIAASFWKSSVKSKIQPKRVQESQIEKERSVSQQFQSQVSMLVARGAIQPADQLKLQYLGIIADRVGPISAIYSELDLLRQEKEKGTSSFSSSYEKLIYGQKYSSDIPGLIDRTLDFLEGSLTKTLAKYNPFQQITDFIFGGRTPRAIREELKSQYAGGKEKDYVDDQAKKYGLNVDEYRLLQLNSKQLLQSAPSYETKMLALLSGIFDMSRYSGSELTSIRKVGFGINDSMNFAVEGKSSVFSSMFDTFKKVTIDLPGINAIVNMIKLPFTLPEKIYTSLVSGYNKIEKMFLGPLSDFQENQDQVMKDLGLFKSDQEQATDFIARGLPRAFSELHFLSSRKLEVLEEILDVQTKQYETFSGMTHDRKKSQSKRLFWDEMLNKFVSEHEYERNKQKERVQILTELEDRFRLTATGRLMFARDWLKSKIKGEQTSSDYDRMIRAGKFAEDIREKYGLRYKALKPQKLVEYAQVRRGTPESRWEVQMFSRSEKLKERQIRENIPARVKRRGLAGLWGTVGLGAGLGTLMAGAGAGAGLLPLLPILAALGVGVGVIPYLKRRMGEEKTLKEVFKGTVGYQEGELEQKKMDKERRIKRKKLKETKEVVDTKTKTLPSSNVLKDILNIQRGSKRYISSSYQTLVEFKTGTFERLDNIYNLIKEISSKDPKDVQYSVMAKKIPIDNYDKPDDYYTDVKKRIKIITQNESDDYYIEARAAAEGGVVTKPGLTTLIGEKGPEAIIPLKNFFNKFLPSNLQSKIEDFEEDKIKNEEKNFRNNNIDILTNIRNVLRDELKLIRENIVISNKGVAESSFSFAGIASSVASLASGTISAITAIGGGLLTILGGKSLLGNILKGKDVIKDAANLTSQASKTSQTISKSASIASKIPGATKAASIASKIPGATKAASIASKIPGATIATKGLGVLSKAAPWMVAAEASYGLGRDIIDPSRLNSRVDEWDKSGMFGKALTLLNPYETGSIAGTKALQSASEIITGDKKNTGFIGNWLYDKLHPEESSYNGPVGPIADLVKKQLIGHEGIRLKKYYDSLGYPTIGIGHKIEKGENIPDKISLDEAYKLFEMDWMKSVNDAKTLPFFKNLDPVRQGAIIDMVFNMGKGGVAGFKRMGDSLMRGDWSSASNNILDSLYASQVGRRANRIATMILTGKPESIKVVEPSVSARVGAYIGPNIGKNLFSSFKGAIPAELHPNEAVLPLNDENALNAIAEAFHKASKIKTAKISEYTKKLNIKEIKDSLFFEDEGLTTNVEVKQKSNKQNILPIPISIPQPNIQTQQEKPDRDERIQTFDTQLDRIISNVFNNSSKYVEKMTKSYVFDSSMNF